MSGDFYIGYQPKMPSGLSRFVRRLVLGGAALGLALSAALVTSQEPFAPSSFEFGVFRDYEGEVIEWPYPILRSGGVSFLLVSPGKHGAADVVSGMDGRTVRLRASRIERGADRMLEVSPGSLRSLAGPPLGRPEVTELGTVRLWGEVVDSKCYFGVMNPGGGKVHRDCAVRCISGGIPPALLVRDSSGRSRTLLLVGSDGRALHREVLDYVAEAAGMRGRLVRMNSLLILMTEPREWRRE